MAAIGIDLGTTNSVGAFYNGAVANVLPSQRADCLVPSVVALYHGALVVGDEAKDMAMHDPANAIWSVKRLMGRKFDDEKVAELRKHIGYSIVPASDDDATANVLLGGKRYSPVDISAKILERIKIDAERSLGQPVTHAVITVPAYFQERQRAATRQAGEKAGLVVRKIIDEPSSAAVAHGYDLAAGESRRLLVFDLGGGTFDVSLIVTAPSGEAMRHFEVEATDGDNWLGGDDFDRVLVEEFVEYARRAHGFVPPDDGRFALFAKQQAERTKIKLSTLDAATMLLLGVGRGKGGELLDIDMPVTRARFEELIRGYVETCVEKVRAVLRQRAYSPERVDTVLLVGGSTLVPAVRDAVVAVFGAERVKQLVQPFHAVALGAAVLAATLRGVQCPGCWREADEGAAKCPNCGESLAAAAAVGGTSLFERTALPLGIRAVRDAEDDAFEVVIPANESYPLAQPATRVFLTGADNCVRVQVYEGDSRFASKNELQGEIFISPADLKAMGLDVRAGSPVRVSMNYDRNRVVRVRVQIQGFPVDKELQLTHSFSGTYRTGIAADREKWKENVEFWLKHADHLCKRYSNYMDQEQRDRLDSQMLRARQALAQEVPTGLESVSQDLTMAVYSCGAASTLLLAEVVPASSPEAQKRLNDSVNQFRAVYSTDKGRSRGLEKAIRAAVSKALGEMPSNSAGYLVVPPKEGAL